MAGKALPVLPSQSLVDHTASPDVQIWQEALVGVEILLLRASPVFYGWGAPRGDGSAVILIPGFLGTDVFLTEMHAWLKRMGYTPYFSGIGLNADCPNLLIRKTLTETLNKAKRDTGRRVHLIGHSLGGIIARSLAGKRAKDIGSVITMGSPFRGTVVHPSVLKAANMVRAKILEQHGRGVLPECYTGRCTCDFLQRLKTPFPASVMETAIYTRSDGVVDWRYCMTGDPETDFEVPGTHIGLAFNPTVYGLIADRLAMAHDRVAAASSRR